MTHALENFIHEMHRIRTTQGEEAYREAVRSFIRKGLSEGGQSARFVASLARGLDFIDFETLQAEVGVAEVVEPPPATEPATEPSPEPATEPSPEPATEPATEVPNAFAEALRSQLPGLQSKAQANAFMVSFEAYRAVVNAILSGHMDKELQARETLSASFNTIRQATEITNKLREVPEAATSLASDEFRTAPAQWTEYDKQRKLLNELEGLRSLSDLSDWWKTNRKRIDEIQTPGLRNPLLDLVRSKKVSLSAETP